MTTQVNPEVNDRDIGPLFHWFDKFTLVDAYGKDFDVWIRLVGDPELQRARVFATRQSADLRKELKDLNSDERIARIPEIDDFDSIQTLVDIIQFYKYKEYIKFAVENVIVKKPKDLKSDADLEEQESYQKQLDQWEETRKEKIKEYATKLLEKEKEVLLVKSKEELYKEFVQIVINKLCEDRFHEHFMAMCTYFGTYKDQQMKERFFNGYDEFYFLRKEFKDQFINAYNSLDISSDDLKN